LRRGILVKALQSRGFAGGAARDELFELGGGGFEGHRLRSWTNLETSASVRTPHIPRRPRLCIQIRISHVLIGFASAIRVRVARIFCHGCIQAPASPYQR
jgi:hypothetical protein